MKCDIGLRARKKAATRSALCAAAGRMALDQGLDAVTVEAIAEAAGVSTRTFHNYFSSKEEALLAYGEHIAQGWAEALLARPQEEDLWTAIEVVLRDAVAQILPGITPSAATATLFEDSPEIRAGHADLQIRTRKLMCGAVAERTGADADHDFYPRLVAHAAFAAVSAAVDLWVAGAAHGQSLDELIHAGFTQLRSGLSGSPHTTSADNQTGRDR